MTERFIFRYNLCPLESMKYEFKMDDEIENSFETYCHRLQPYRICNEILIVPIGQYHRKSVLSLCNA